MKKDLERLQSFLALLPTDRRFTFEFRHESWFDEDVFDALRAHDVALCVAESEEFRSRERRDGVVGVPAPASPGLRRPDAGRVAEAVAAHSWNDAYVFFKHDYIDGAGPLAVERFVSMMGSGSGGVRAPGGALLSPDSVRVPV